MKRSQQVLLNVVIYQAVWFVCVLAAAAGRPAIALLAAAIAVAWHLFTAKSPSHELILIAIAAALGACFESLLVASGIMTMTPALLLGSLLPLWMAGLWAAFATTLNVSLRGLRHRYLISAALAAAGAPLAYAAATRMGAILWTHEMTGLVAVGAGWSVLLPILMKCAQRFDGFRTA